MFCAILPINVRIDMIYLLGLCNFIKLSNICHHDLLEVLNHPIRIDRLINMPFEKQLQTCVRIPYKNINMSITDVNTASGRTPVSYPNQAFTNIVNSNRHFTTIMNPLRWNQQLLYRTNSHQSHWGLKCILLVPNIRPRFCCCWISQNVKLMLYLSVYNQANVAEAFNYLKISRWLAWYW